MNPTIRFPNIAIFDGSIDKNLEAVTIENNKTCLNVSNVFTGTNFILTNIEDKFSKYGGFASGRCRYSKTDFMNSKANLESCEVLGTVGVGHLRACSTNFFDDIVVKGNINLNACKIFHNTLLICNIGNDIEIEIKNSLIKHIIVHSPKPTDDEIVRSFDKMSAQLTKDEIFHTRGSQGGINFAASGFCKEKLEKIERECFPQTRPKFLKLDNCLVERVTFMGNELGTLELSGSSKVDMVINGF